MMAGNNVSIAQILEKLPSRDKDFRYMATSDLQNELLRPSFKVDAKSEEKLCIAVLQQLQDVSGDISALAVKCLGLLVKRISEANIEQIIVRLAKMVTTGKQAQEREISSLGLKAVVADLPRGKGAQNVAKNLTPTLIAALISKETETVNACLEVLDELVSKLGTVLEPEHQNIKEALIRLLQADKASHRKRTLHCLGSLAPFLSDKLLSEVADSIVVILKTKSLPAQAQLANINALGTLSRSAGWRLGQIVAEVIPMVVKYSSQAPEGNDELKEACLQALEAFVSRSPQEAQPLLSTIFDEVLKCLAYDPNFTDDMEDDEEEEEEEYADGLSDEGYSDDEDTSWKVRRAATKALSAIIAAYPNLLQELYTSSSRALTARFKEREETVKVDAFNVFVDLIRQVGIVGGHDRGSQVAAKLDLDVPGILKAASRQLRDKSPKTRAGVFLILKELVVVAPVSVTRDIDQLMPGIIAALNDKSSSTSVLKIQALLFLGLALQRKREQQVRQPQIIKLAPPVFQAAADKYYKVAAEAIRVCEVLVTAIRPAAVQPLQPALQHLVPLLFECVQHRLAAQDQDQEVKEAAISCAAAITAGLGDVTNGAYLQQVKILLDRLKNDVTRLPAVKALAKIAQSPLQLSLAPHVQPLLTELISFLRKANRPLRQASLTTLNAVLLHKESTNSVPVDQVVAAIAQLVSDSDLLLTSASLQVGTTLLRCHPSSTASVSTKLLQPALLLSQSSLLQGSALEVLKGFLIALLHTQTPSCSFESLLNSLLAAGNAEDAGKVAQSNVAECVAALCQAAGSTKTATTVQSLLSVLQSPSGQPSAKHLALLSIGEVGRTTDLSAFTNLQQTLTSSLASSSDDLKTAAALSLGAVAVGNLQTYLPFILQQIQEQASNPKDQYLLLRALNEVITSVNAQQLPPNYQSEALNLLLESCESKEECRNTVSECLGHLALLNPPIVIPVIQQKADSSSVAMRATVVTALKYTLVDQPHPVDEHLQTSLPALIRLLSDSDRHVRKAAVQLLSIAAHNKPSLIREQLPSFLPALYQQTAKDPSLVRIVELGPFQHQIDDGLELRKAAFECMDILLETASDKLSMPDFIRRLTDGLQDHYDVKMPCHLLLSKLAVKAGGNVLAALDSLSKPLEKTLNVRLKTDAVKQEVDRNEDMLRSCLRAIDACTRINDVDSSSGFRQLMDRVVLVPPIAPKFQAVQEERREAEGRSIREG